MHSGALAIPAADGKVGTAYMARMPIVTKDNGPINSIIQIATDLREPGTHATPYERAKDWLTIYWWVDPDTGQNWSHGYGGVGVKKDYCERLRAVVVGLVPMICPGDLRNLNFIPLCWNGMVICLLIYCVAEGITIRLSELAAKMSMNFIRVQKN